RRARSSTIISAITRTSATWTHCSPPGSDVSAPQPTEDPMNDAPAAPKPKKSVALSGVTAANTALCTVGRSGNDLHYRGYDILEVAEGCEFEEHAHLLVHEPLP